jgi:hypothetical protein
MSLEHVEHSVGAGFGSRGTSTQSLLLAAFLAGACFPAFGVETVRPEPTTPRELYNEGTARLRDGKLREAEAFLQVAVARNNEKIQTPALYNLGQTRFRQGMETLKDIKDGKGTQAKGDAAAARGGDAILAADLALSGFSIDALVEAYMQGKGARKELKLATEAVKKAMDKYGVVLQRWQRASGDFKSAYELRAAALDARDNAGIVDQHIARLVDELEQMKLTCQQCQNTGDSLKEKMKKLKEKMPEQQKKQCENPGEEDEEEDGKPRLPKEGDKEGPSKDGHEIPLTPEEAGRLLEAMRLDGNRKLPVGVGDSTPPRTRTGKQW